MWRYSCVVVTCSWNFGKSRLKSSTNWDEIFFEAHEHKISVQKSVRKLKICWSVNSNYSRTYVCAQRFFGAYFCTRGCPRELFFLLWKAQPIVHISANLLFLQALHLSSWKFGFWLVTWHEIMLAAADARRACLFCDWLSDPCFPREPEKLDKFGVWLDFWHNWLVH